MEKFFIARQSFQLQMTTVGPALIPLVEGKPVAQADYFSLTKSIRKILETKRAGLLKKLQATFENLRGLESQTVEKLRSADQAMADFTTSRLFKDLLSEYKESEAIIKYLESLVKTPKCGFSTFSIS